MSSSEENKELCKLININKDAAEFYSDAKEKVQNLNFVTTFKNLEIIHDSVAKRIAQRVKANGGDPEMDGTVSGKTAQFFGELMARVSNDVDESLVSSLEEAEDRCLHSIEDALEEEDISPATRAVLAQEYSTLRQTHDYMKELKSYMKAA